VHPPDHPRPHLARSPRSSGSHCPRLVSIAPSHSPPPPARNQKTRTYYLSDATPRFLPTATGARERTLPPATGRSDIIEFARYSSWCSRIAWRETRLPPRNASASPRLPCPPGRRGTPLCVPSGASAAEHLLGHSLPDRTPGLQASSNLKCRPRLLKVCRTYKPGSNGQGGTRVPPGDPKVLALRARSSRDAAAGYTPPHRRGNISSCSQHQYIASTTEETSAAAQPHFCALGMPPHLSPGGYHRIVRLWFSRLVQTQFWQILLTLHPSIHRRKCLSRSDLLVAMQGA